LFPAGTGLGYDGVYKTWAGQHNASQSKFRTGRPALTWQELSTFMGLTVAGDDPDGYRFAKVREGFDKWLKRNGVAAGLTAVWVR
jgi:hypothetical protein